MNKILVTGATGFIGRHLVKKLRANGHDVFAASSASGDISQRATWDDFGEAELVIHLAGRTFVPDSWGDPAGFVHTNLQGTIRALNYCKDRKARLIFVSSYLYGLPARLPIPEDAALQPNNPYAMSKKLAEDACRFYSDYFDICVTVFRPFNVYGPGQDAKFLIPAIVSQVLEGNAINVKDLDPRRDYLYIDDLTDAFLSAMQRPQKFDIFNIASGTSHSVGEVIHLIQQLAGTELPVYTQSERRQQEIMDTRADIARARQILGWRPRWSLRDGCAALLGDRKVS